MYIIFWTNRSLLNHCSLFNDSSEVKRARKMVDKPFTVPVLAQRITPARTGGEVQRYCCGVYGCQCCLGMHRQRCLLESMIPLPLLFSCVQAENVCICRRAEGFSSKSAVKKDCSCLTCIMSVLNAFWTSMYAVCILGTMLKKETQGGLI